MHVLQHGQAGVEKNRELFWASSGSHAAHVQRLCCHCQRRNVGYCRLEGLMGEVIVFPVDQKTTPKVRGQTFDQRLSTLRRETVPPERREAVARALGRLAGKVGPTPKRGAKRIIEEADRRDLGSHRKRIILLDGEQPDKMGFRSAWADYIGLSETAIKLMGIEYSDNDKERERLLRRIVDARPADNAPELSADALDIQSLLTEYIAKIVRRVRTEVPELEDLQRLMMSHATLFEMRGCYVDLPLGALEWDIPIDAFFFPPDLIEKCPHILIGGNLWWDDPDSSEEAAQFDAWLAQFNSPIGLPEQPYDPVLGFGWKPIRIQAYEAISLLVTPALCSEYADDGKNLYISDWDATISLNGCEMFNTPLIQYCDQPASTKYVSEIVRGNEIYYYREDDFCVPCDDFWGTSFGVLHCADSEMRLKIDTSPSKKPPPFLLDANDDAFKRLNERESTSLVGKVQLEGRALEALQVGNHFGIPRFMPNFNVDDDHPVPASDGTFAACLLRNMRHALEGERLDDIAVAKARVVAEQAKIELEKVAVLVAIYREGLEKN